MVGAVGTGGNGQRGGKRENEGEGGIAATSLICKVVARPSVYTLWQKHLTRLASKQAIAPLKLPVRPSYTY